jgi:hypothetical protein
MCATKYKSVRRPSIIYVHHLEHLKKRKHFFACLLSNLIQGASKKKNLTVRKEQPRLFVSTQPVVQSEPERSTITAAHPSHA